MIGIKQIGIQKCQYGTSRGGLVNHPYSGSWGNRGKGNELQSALENGLSWIGDKVVNFGDYVDQGLSYLVGALPGGGMTAQELLQETKNAQRARNNGERGYVNNRGQYVQFPSTGMSPSAEKFNLNSLNILKKWGSFKKMIGKISKVRYSLPSSKNNYYRLLTNLSDGNTAEAALQDIIKTGVIRANPKGTMVGMGKREHFIGPYFSKGRPYSPELTRKAKVAIIGKERPEVDYLQIGPHQSQLIMDKLGSQFTPLVNGVPNQSPARYFEIWKRGKNPISRHFWFKQKISNSAPDPALFKYPDGSNIMIHMDYGNTQGAFSSGGAYIEKGFLKPGPPQSSSQIGHTWFNREKPYSLVVNKKPLTRAIVGMKENIPGLIRVRDSKIPLGQWNGKSGFVLNSEYATPEAINMKKMLEFQYSPKYKRFKLITNGGN